MSAVTALARRVLPARVRAPISRMLYSWSARQVAQRYSRHYSDAQRRYVADGHVPSPSRPSLDTVGVRTLIPAASSNLFVLPPDYATLVGRIQRDLRGRLALSANSWFHPPPAHLPERTEDVDEVRRGAVVTLKMKNHLNIDGLEALCAELIPEIERAVYGSYVLVDKVYVYRTFVSTHREGGSWLWHYDEHPVEVLKLMIYLTDVDAGAAPFTYLASPSGTAVLGSRHPLYGQSRIPASVMDRYLAKGCRVQPVTGAAGTAVLFNDTVIHRQTFAETRHRDVLVLQLRPAVRRIAPFVDSRWTGSFPHRDFNRDPEQLTPETGLTVHQMSVSAAQPVRPEDL